MTSVVVQDIDVRKYDSYVGREIDVEKTGPYGIRKFKKLSPPLLKACVEYDHLILRTIFLLADKEIV